jgi:hypothetical protein
MLREFVDPKGVNWKVWDVWPSERLASGALMPVSTFPSLTQADGWLCFESANEKRRLSPIPPGWETCDCAILSDLCERAGYSTSTLTPRDSAVFRDPKS